jgi:hypothetical protein
MGNSFKFQTLSIYNITLFSKGDQKKKFFTKKLIARSMGCLSSYWYRSRLEHGAAPEIPTKIFDSDQYRTQPPNQ